MPSIPTDPTPSSQPNAMLAGVASAPPHPETTGRFLVLFDDEADLKNVDAFSEIASVRMAHSSDFDDEAPTDHQIGDNEGLYFEELGVAVVNAPPQQMMRASATRSGSGRSQILEAERILYAIGPPSVSAEYLEGYRDAVNALIERAIARPDVPVRPAPAGDGSAPMPPEDQGLTWGLRATKIGETQYTGAGVRIAVLDTGLDLAHSDYAGRQIVAKSFIEGEEVHDKQGHGTHCAGTVCGPRSPGQLPRYGVAPDASLYVGKVLNNAGRGADGGILAGIQWAMKQQCAVISMSLGGPVAVGETHSPIYEQVARRALRAGTLIIAAAGNDSRRPGRIAPVSRPANSPSIVAVAAVDEGMAMGWFSNGGLNPEGGQIDIAGPGVEVHSSYPGDAPYRSLSGTSMATPHVAGIAALYAQAYPKARGHELLTLLLQHARRLGLPSRDVGAGLVQAP